MDIFQLATESKNEDVVLFRKCCGETNWSVMYIKKQFRELMFTQLSVLMCLLDKKRNEK